MMIDDKLAYNPTDRLVQGATKVTPPLLTRYIFRYENSIAMIKEVCLDRATLHNFCDTKHDMTPLMTSLPIYPN